MKLDFFRVFILMCFMLHVPVHADASVIASPCISALGYIGQTRNAWLGSIALFAMGISLLILGTLGERFLPKAGPWRDGVNVFLGLILLGVAICILDRVVSDFISMLLWAALALLTSVYMGLFAITPRSRFGQFIKGLGFLVMLYGLALTFGAFMGNINYFQPLTFNSVGFSKNGPSWQTVSSINELQKALKTALKKVQRKPAIVDFYADWCVSCKNMANEVFSAPEVQKLLSQFELIRVDVTNNTEAEIALTKRYNVIAPSTFLFFNTDSVEIETRIDGEVNAQEFAQMLEQILLLS